MRQWRISRAQWAAVAASLISFLLGVMSDTVSQILAKAIGETLSGLLTILLAIAALIAIVLVVGRALRPVPRDLVPREAKPPRMKGLILLIGKGLQGKPAQEQSAAYAIEYHRLDSEGRPILRSCWLIPSTAEESQVYASELKTYLHQHGVEAEVVPPVNELDLHDTYTAVTRIYESDLAKHRLGESEVIADFTGGTKPMSLGMALACVQADRVMEYMTGRQPGIASVPMLIQFASSAAKG